RGLHQSLVRTDRGVADERIDGPELGQAPRDHRLDGRGIRDVAERRHDKRAGFRAFRGHGLELLVIRARVQDEARAFGCESERDRAPDVPAGAGDQRGLALEPHGTLLLWHARGGRLYKLALRSLPSSAGGTIRPWETGRKLLVAGKRRFACSSGI